MTDHGASGYSHGCRCESCRNAHREQANDYRARMRAGHNARSDALSLLGLDVDDAGEIVAAWTASRLRNVVLILASAVDPDMPVSKFGAAA